MSNHTLLWKDPESGEVIEVNLIDSPGFDDSAEDDAFALKELPTGLIGSSRLVLEYRVYSTCMISPRTESEAWAVEI